MIADRPLPPLPAVVRLAEIDAALRRHRPHHTARAGLAVERLRLAPAAAGELASAGCDAVLLDCGVVASRSRDGSVTITPA